MAEKNKTAGEATGGQVGTERDSASARPYYITSAPASSSTPADPLTTYNMARYVAGATDADLDMIQRTFPDAPLGSRDNLRAWLETQPDLLRAVLATDPAAPPTPIGNAAVDLRLARGIDADGTELSRDYAHANVLATLFKNRYRWARGLGGWMHYNGRVWQPVPEETVAKEAADALRQYYAHAVIMTNKRDVIDSLAQKIKETGIYARIQGALNFLRGWPEFMTYPQEWDSDPYLLNCENGTLDLRTFELRPHDPSDLLTMMVNAPYAPQSQPRYWQAHLELVLPDPNIRRQVQRDLGISLVGTAQAEILPIWYGVGANGKSTTLRVLMEIMGDYAQMAAPRLLLASRHERHPTELAELRGRRLVFSVETGEGSRLDEERVKQLTGGERIRAHFMRQDNIEFERSWTLVLVTNHKPVIRGVDNAIWRRVRLVPWTVVLPPEQQQPQDQIVAELLSERGAILAWIVAGLRDFQQDWHWQAEAVRVATEAYRAEQDVLGSFLTDCCELGPRFIVSVGELYAAYTDWCGQNGEEPLGKTTFGRKLRDRGITQKRNPERNTRLWVGVRLLDQYRIGSDKTGQNFHVLP